MISEPQFDRLLTIIDSIAPDSKVAIRRPRGWRYDIAKFVMTRRAYNRLRKSLKSEEELKNISLPESKAIGTNVPAIFELTVQRMYGGSQSKS